MILSKKEFQEKYIHSSLDTFLFDKIKNIFSNPELKNKHVNKQRRIEKLVNVFLLKKEENKYVLNPLWSNKLNSLFKEEFDLFNISYHEILISDLKTNFLKPLNLKFIITSHELFHIIIFTYINSLNNESFIDSNELGLPKKSSLSAEILKTLRKFLDYKLKLYFFIKYLDSKRIQFNHDLTLEKLNIDFEKGNKLFNINNILIDILKSNNIQDIPKELSSHLNQFKTFFKKQELDLNTFLYRIIQMSLNIFFELNIFKKYTTRSNKLIYDYVNVFNLEKFSQLQIICYLHNQIPMIVPPLDWNYKGKEGGFLLNKNNESLVLTKKIMSGYSKISYSQYLIDTINLIQKKEYKINKDYLSYIKTDLFKKHYGLKTFNELYDLYLNFKKQQLKYCDLLKKNNIFEDNILLIYSEEKNKLYATKAYKESTIEKRTILVNELKLKLNINSSMIEEYKILIQLEGEFTKYLNLYKNHLFIETFSDLYKNYNLYMVSNTDWRTRFYPVGRGLHRASGLYKYVLADANKIHLLITCDNDLLLLKKAISLYYKNIFNNVYTYDMNLLLSWFYENIEKDFNQKEINLILAFFKQIISTEENLNFVCENKYINHLYYLILNSKETSLFVFSLYEYFQYLKNKQHCSEWTFDFDQCSSGPMIYSLLSNDDNMLQLTNIYKVEKNIKYDLYNHYLQSFYEMVTKLLNDKKELSEWEKYLLEKKNIIFDRSFSKLIIMPTFYNMGKKGIKEHLLEIANKHSLFINNYKLFVSFLLPIITNLLKKLYKNTINYQQILVDICYFIYENNEHIHIKTLDGSLIKYAYLNEKMIYGKFYKGRKLISYRIYLPFEYSIKESLSEKHYLTFPPNYIHSLDAALCRIICNIFYYYTNTILEPLHDSFRVSLSNIHYLSVIIKYVYCYYFLNILFHQKKLGIDIILNGNLPCTYKICYNSENYELYKKLFPFSDIKYENILLETFIVNNLFNKDIEIKVQELLKKNNMLNVITDEAKLNDFINSEYMFYF